uniref:Uncharacterized protein n=1 Tax=Glossina pallidipes TaxID=7398 RepID=A0A1B0A340_GLOPL
MHQAGGKSGRPKNSYTAEALETIKQDLTRFQVQKDNGVQSHSKPSQIWGINDITSSKSLPSLANTGLHMLSELEDRGKERLCAALLSGDKAESRFLREVDGDGEQR